MKLCSSAAVTNPNRLLCMRALMPVLLISFSALLTISAATVNDEGSADSDTTVCRLWMAPSNLATPHLSKFGLYAGVDFDAEELLPFPEVALPFVDFFIDANKNNPYRRGILDFLEPQFWLADYTGAKFEGNYSATSFLPGLGALAAYHSGVYNVGIDQTAVWTKSRDPAFPPSGQADASRASISHLHSVVMRTTRHIPAGMELFANFGDSWDAEKDLSVYQDKVVRQDYVDADAILERMLEYMERFPKMSESLKEDTVDFMLRSIVNQAGGFRAKVLQSLIPNNFRLLKKVKEAGGTFNYRFPDYVKTPQWLAKHGLCVDNLQVKPSTIAGAGRGAFARRPLKEDDVISPIPTTLIGDASLMDMYSLMSVADNDDNQGLFYKTDEPPRGQQIALNYCYGHSESSLLLLPLAPMVNYVNHASEGEPNAFLRWSEHDHIVNDYATQDNLVHDVMNHRSHLVTLELVALRDIAVGEEVVIDYGEEWVAAWEDYQSRASMVQPGATWPLKADDLREVFKAKAYPVGVTDENNPYPPGVATACFLVIDQTPDGVPHFTKDGEDLYMWTGNATALKGADLSYCDLTERMETPEGSYNYTVRTRSSDDEYMEILNVPHAAVTVVDVPYSSDIHHPEAFRHPIGIPDDIWPQHWRDLR